jgi:hypothetical protein
MTSFEVIDTAVKIGMGAIIAGFFGSRLQNKQFTHESIKRKEEQFYRRQDERKTQYLEFFAMSYSLLHKYEFTVGDKTSEDYTSYLKALASVQLIASEPLRFKALSVANSIIFCVNDACGDTDLSQSLRDNAKLQLALFEALAQKDVTADFVEET